MISRTKDYAQYITQNYVVVDVGGFEHLTIQVIGLTGTCNISGTDDGGGVTGSADDTPRNAANFTAVQAVNLTTGAAATAVTGTTLFRISPVSFRYLRLGDGATFEAAKVLIHGSTVV